jgi:hypothetical protein
MEEDGGATETNASGTAGKEEEDSDDEDWREVRTLHAIEVAAAATKVAATP